MDSANFGALSSSIAVPTNSATISSSVDTKRSGTSAVAALAELPARGLAAHGVAATIRLTPLTCVTVGIGAAERRPADAVRLAPVTDAAFAVAHTLAGAGRAAVAAHADILADLSHLVVAGEGVADGLSFVVAATLRQAAGAVVHRPAGLE